MEWRDGSIKQLQNVTDFFKEIEMLGLSDDIVDRIIEIRRIPKIKLPDAIIAATATIQDMTLISHKDDDFRKVLGLKYLNPILDI